jgi:CHAT domain-containing protein
MVALHRNLSAGQPPALALSQAQMRAARLAADGPGFDLDWAAFVFIGRADF